MPTDVDRLVQRSDELIERARSRVPDAHGRRARQRREAEILKRVGRIALADGAIILAAIVAGLILPSGIGTTGAMIVMLLLVLTTLLLAVFPAASAPQAEALVQVPLKALPQTTERWLEAQRPALPAPARTLVDSIGVKLDALAPQLAILDENQPAAAEVRKLVGEQLPELVKGYQRVPEPLRGVERHGLTPDQQLSQGLQLIDDEIAEMTRQLAQGDLDALATRGRYLQIKYRDEAAEG